MSVITRTAHDASFSPAATPPAPAVDVLRRCIGVQPQLHASATARASRATPDVLGGRAVPPQEHRTDCARSLFKQPAVQIGRPARHGTGGDTPLRSFEHLVASACVRASCRLCCASCTCAACLGQQLQPPSAAASGSAPPTGMLKRMCCVRHAPPLFPSGVGSHSRSVSSAAPSRRTSSTTHERVPYLATPRYTRLRQ